MFGWEISQQDCVTSYVSLVACVIKLHPDGKQTKEHCVIHLIGTQICGVCF